MKVRTICAALAGIAAILITPAHAQQAGFSVAIAPPGSPVLPFVSAPIGSFAVAPTIAPPGTSPFVRPNHSHPRRVVLQPWPFPVQSAIAPYPGMIVVAPGSTVYAPGATVVAGGNNVIITNPIGTNPIGTPNTAVAPGSYVYPGPGVSGGVYANHNPQGTDQTNIVLPSVGTPRSQVIAQFGNPLVSVITMNSETMHFNGGITISLQNGLVIRP